MIFTKLSKLFKKEKNPWRKVKSYEGHYRYRFRDDWPYPKEIEWFNKKWTYRGFIEHDYPTGPEMFLIWYGPDKDFLCAIFPKNIIFAYGYEPDYYIEEHLTLEDFKVFCL